MTAMTPVEGAVNPLAKMIGRAIEAKPRADELLAGMERVPAVITNASDAGEVGQYIKMLRAHRKTLEDERKQLVGPFNEGVKGINARFKLVTEPLREAEEDLGRRNTVFLAEQARLAREEEARLRKIQEDAAVEEAAALEDAGEHEQAAEVLEEGADGVAPIVQEVKTVRGAYGAATGLRDFWVCEVEDISKVPHEYLMPNMAALNKAVRSDGVREIPGCKIWNDQKAVTR